MQGKIIQCILMPAGKKPFQGLSKPPDQPAVVTGRAALLAPGGCCCLPWEVIGAAQMRQGAPALCRRLTAAKSSTASLRLKRMCTMPVRLASAFAPMEQTMAVVMQSPRQMPMRRG